MFADDTNISFSSNALSDLEHLINFELQSLNRWLTLWEPRPQELEIKIQPMGFLAYLSQEIRILGQFFFST